MHQLSAVTSAAAGEHPDLGGEFCASMIIDGYVISNQMPRYEVWFVTIMVTVHPQIPFFILS